jgi:sulfur carrier protein
VAVNGTVVPRSAWESTALAERDRLEVLGATQGG